MLSATFQQRGFTVIELLVGIAILALMFGLGVPTMSNYLQNSKIATAASSYFMGIQTARAEAIRRNVRTEFVLTDTPTSTPDVANALAPSANGRNWVVRAASGAAFTLVEAKAGGEGEGSVINNYVQVTGAATAPAVADGIIPFNGFGATVSAGGYSLEIKNPTAGVCVLDGGTLRCRRITVTPGGKIAACDPAAPAGDSRAC